jgi:hypothetical protein
MKSVIIDDPEATEQMLCDAGFEVALQDDGFLVNLTTRRPSRMEIADVIGCKTEDLQQTPHGVLVR